MSFTTKRIAEIRARCEVATMWGIEESGLTPPDADGYIFVPECTYLEDTLIQYAGSYENGGHDWAFVCHARTDLPDALDEIERLQDIVKKYRLACDAVISAGTTVASFRRHLIPLYGETAEAAKEPADERSEDT